MSDNNQKQNEALIRLMLAARYQDSKITLAEGNEFKKRMESIPWQSGTALDLFVMQETARVRSALADHHEEQKFLESQCACFDTREAKSSALETIRMVLETDGIDPRESKFLARIEEMMER